MKFNYTYTNNSTVQQTNNNTQMSFAPDIQRQPTYFIGELRQNINFREAISALHHVVVCDLRFKPKDREAYKQWRSQQDDLDWQLIAAQQQTVANKIQPLQEELTRLQQESRQRRKPYYAARQKYYSYLYKKDYDAWFVLDPVITVHPDEVFFECFSQDESTYGRLGASYEVFQNINEFACGTTNIDYSTALYNEFQKVRSYKTTQFTIDPSGFEVETQHEESFKEVKIDLPDSWVRGFLQVSSAMSLPTTQFDLHPMDIYNICLVLRRHKEKKGPRGMRYELTPGQPVKVIFEPWNIELTCARSPYTGNETQEIRVWGRRRLHILERLIPIAKKFTVHLLGTGMPSFYIADLGDMSFTLGLSGWTANDWSSSGNFDLMASRTEIDRWTKQHIFNSLQENWAEKPHDLAKRLNMNPAVILGALGAYTQAGRAIYDLNKGVYRIRELTKEPLPMEKLRFANKREAKASRFLDNNRVAIDNVLEDGDGVCNLQGKVTDREKTHNPSLTIDADQRMIQAQCDCNWYKQNKLYKGPCEHILALKMEHNRRY